MVTGGQFVALDLDKRIQFWLAISWDMEHINDTELWESSGMIFPNLLQFIISKSAIA